MKSENASSKTFDVEIKKLELEIARLQLDLAEKERQREVLQEKKGDNFLGIYRNERKKYVNDTVKLFNQSKTGFFQGRASCDSCGKLEKSQLLYIDWKDIGYLNYEKQKST